MLRPLRALAVGPIGLVQAVERGGVAIGGVAEGAGGIAGGGGSGSVGAAPDDADEEGSEGGEAGGDDGDGGLGGGPDGDGDVVPCDVLHFAVLVEDDEAGDADGADAGGVVRMVGICGGTKRGERKTYVRPTVKIAVRTSFCGWLVRRRQRIGMG